MKEKRMKKYHDMTGFFVFVSVILGLASKLYEMGIFSFILIVGFFGIALFFLYFAWNCLLYVWGLMYEKYLKDFIGNLKKTKHQIEES